MNSIEAELEEIGEDVREVKRQTAGTDEHIQELAHDILPLLPDVDEDRDPQEYGQYHKPLEEYEPAEVEIPVTVDAILYWLNKDPDIDPSYPLNRGDVVDALEFLEGQYFAQSRVVGGEKRWAKDM